MLLIILSLQLYLFLENVNKNVKGLKSGPCFVPFKLCDNINFISIKNENYPIERSKLRDRSQAGEPARFQVDIERDNRKYQDNTDNQMSSFLQNKMCKRIKNTFR